MPEALIMAKMLQLEINDALKTGHRRCRHCLVRLIVGKNTYPSRRELGGLACKTCMNFERYGAPTRPDAVKRLKHRLYMREWMRKKAANKRRKVAGNERSKDRKHR